MTVGPEGRVAWKVQTDFDMAETEVRAARRVREGRRIVHAFTISVSGRTERSSWRAGPSLNFARRAGEDAANLAGASG